MHKNLKTLVRWVEEASGGFLTADEGMHRRLELRRADGEPMGHFDGIDGPTPIVGHITEVWVPEYGTLDGRNKRTLRTLADAVSKGIREGGGTIDHFARTLDFRTKHKIR